MTDTKGPMRSPAWRAVFTSFALLMGMNAFYWAFGAAPDRDVKISVSSNRDNILYVGLWVLLYATSCVIVLKSWLRGGISLTVLALVPFVAYIIASASWAEHTSSSATKGAMLALNVVIAEALCCVVSPAQLLKILVRVSLALLVISFAMLAIAPQAVLSDALRPGLLISGEFFGAFGSKGVLGRMACISIIIIVFLPDVLSSRWSKAAAIAAFLVGALLANAMSAIFGGVFALALLTAARIMPRFSKPMFTLAAATALGWSLVAPFIDIGEIATSVGRTADLTGRGDFWPMAPGVILNRPYLGYGYGDFFDPTPYAGGWQVWGHERYFFTPDFHNNAIDVAVGLGLIGLACYLVVLSLALAIFNYRTLERRSREILSAFLISVTMSSGTEDDFLVHNSIMTILMFYCVLTIGRRYGRFLESSPSAPADQRGLELMQSALARGVAPHPWSQRAPSRDWRAST